MEPEVLAAESRSTGRPEPERRAGPRAPAPGVRVAVVLPCYRVEPHIEAVVAGIPSWIGDVIAVDDKSPDGTLAALERIRDPRLVVLRHAENRGVGGAMQTGFAEALRRGVDVVVKMDGDGQMDPEQLAKLVDPLVRGKADVTKGNRWADLEALKQMPLVRLAGNTGLGFLVRLASGYWSVFDPTNGYLALRTDVLRMIQRPLPMRYFFESGLLIELGILRACVQDVPIPARYGEEESSLSVTKSLLGFPPRLAAGLVRRVFWRYYVYDFTTVSVYLLLGIPALFFGTLYGLSVWLHGEASETFAAPGPVMIAAMPIILGFQLLLQAVAADIAATPREPISPPLAR